jgi:hypothetical protein
VVNVGAGTGSYEPRDRRVVAVEPSAVMIAARPPGAAFLGRPEAYLDTGVRANMSAFRLLRPDGLAEGLGRLRRDLASGAWDARHGHMRDLPHFDTGHRVVVSDVTG